MMKIQCSIPILTLNSAKTLERLIKSLENFDDVYIVDGNSTDETRDIARKYNLPIYKQVETDEPNVRIENFVKTRHKSYSFAKCDWILDIDSDEYITAELEDEIRKIIDEGDQKKVCHIQKFPLLDNGKIIKHAFFIPDFYPRLFNLKTGIHYNADKLVHEHLVIPDGARQIYLKNAVISGYPPYRQCLEKDDYYLSIMRQKRPSASVGIGFKIAAINCLKALNITIKSVIISMTHPRDALPPKYVWRFFRYHLILAKDILRVIGKKRKHKIFMPEDHMDELYHSKNPLVRYAHIDRLHKIVSQLPEGKNLKIFDAGCGEGHLIQEMHDHTIFKNCEFYGADITEIALQKARDRCPYAKIYNADLAKLDFPNEFFDVVVCTEVLEHIKHYKEVIGEIKRVLKKDGYFIITFPNEIPWTIARFLLGRRPIKVSDHINSFYPRTMKHLTDMKEEKLIKLPFNLPLFVSLGSLMKFKK